MRIFWWSLRPRPSGGWTATLLSRPISRRCCSAGLIWWSRRPCAIHTCWRASTARAKWCMQRDPRAWLWDVREAAQAIGDFVAGLDSSGYAKSELVHSAVERKFEVIGEALNQLSKADASMAARVPHLPQIVAFR